MQSCACSPEDHVGGLLVDAMPLFWKMMVGIHCRIIVQCRRDCKPCFGWLMIPLLIKPFLLLVTRKRLLDVLASSEQNEMPMMSSTERTVETTTRNASIKIA